MGSKQSAATRKAKEGLVQHKRQMDRRRTLLEVKAEATEFMVGLRRGADPAEAVQLILDNLLTGYEYATQKVMLLDEDSYFENTLTGPRLNAWIVEQERLGLQMAHVAGKAAGMGLAERKIVLHEQQAALFATFVEAALVAVGLNPDSRREVHSLIARGMEDIEGFAEEIKPSDRVAA